MKIAAFNIRNLGWKKVSNPFVVRRITEIMGRYSVVVILEVVDKTGRTVEKLLQQLNKRSSTPYAVISSRPLGRDKYKEQFVCFYRPGEVELKASHQYEDNQAGDRDAFAREPFILHFLCPAAVVKDLVVIPVHTKPEDSEKELDELHDVVESVKRRWKTTKIMILGDFNADGRYLSAKEKKRIRISRPPYEWLIEDDVDTTSSNLNDHTYDRIVVYGKPMLDAIVPGSAKPFNFQRELKLTDEQALSISDHYPVEVELRTGPKQKAQRQTAQPRSRKARSTNGQAERAGPQKKKRKASEEKKTRKRKRGQPSHTPAKRRRST